MQRNTLLVLAGAAVLIISAALTLDISAIVHYLAHAAQQLRETHPLTAGFAAMLVFTAWSMLLPAPPMELSISYIFGFWRGFTIVYFGKLCTCLLAYILSRSCLRSWAHEAFSRHEVLRAFESECVSRPWRVAFLLRAVYIPLPVKNYGGGALGLPALPWLIATLIVEVPDTYFTAALARRRGASPSCSTAAASTARRRGRRLSSWARSASSSSASSFGSPTSRGGRSTRSARRASYDSKILSTNLRTGPPASRRSRERWKQRRRSAVGGARGGRRSRSH